jgi:hypothetical protein
MHTISSAQPQKVALTTILPEPQRPKCKPAHPLSFFLPNCPIKKLLQPTVSLRKNYYYHIRPSIQKIRMLTQMPTTSKNKNCVLS